MESSASSSTSEVFQPVLQQTGLPLSVYPRLPPPPPAPGSSSGVPAIIITAPNGEVVGEQHHPARLEAAPVGPPSLPLLPPPEALLQRSSEVAGHPSPSASQFLASSPSAEPRHEHSSSTAHVPSTSVLSFPHVIAFSSLPSTEDQGPTAASGLMSLVPSMDEVPLPITQASRPMNAVPSVVRGSPLVLHVPNSTVEAPTLEAPVALVAAVPPSVVPTAATLNLAPLPPTHALPAVLVPPPADAPAAPEAAIPSVMVVPPPPLPVMPLGLPPMVPRSASLPSTSDDDLVSVHAATAMDLGMAPAPPAAVSRGDAPSMEAPRVPTSRRASSASTSHSTQHVDPKQQIMCPAVVTLPIRRTRNDWERVQGNKLFGSSSDEASEPDEGTSDAFPLGTPRSVTTAFRNESERGVSRSRSKKQRRHERKHRKVITENQVHEMDSYSATTSSSLGLSQESGSDRRAQRDAEGSTLAAAVPPPDFVPTIKDFPAAMDVPLESVEVVESRPPCGPIATLIAQCADNDLSGAWEGLGPAASPSPVELGLDSSTSVLSDTTECALLSLTIQGMSGLHADVSVVHPFVRVWLVHCLTGENLLTAPLAEEVACGVTFPFDLRLRRSRAPWWDTELLLPLNMERVRQAPKEGVLLFEVLDCGNETINGFFLPRNGIYPICWGFTMLYDCYGKLNISDDQQMHVQMFPYPMRAPWYMQLLQQVLPTSWSFAGASAPSEVHMEGEVLFSHADTSSNHYTPPVVGAPDIFHIFKNPMFRKVRYEAGLVFVAKRPKVYPIGYKPKSADMQPYEVYLLDLLAKGFRCSVLPLRPTEGRRPSIARSPVQNRRHVSFAVAATGNDYVRRAGERTLPPTTILQTCTVPGKVTCMDFSHSGLVLALGITHDLQHYVELRNPSSEGATVLNQLRGHVGHIHRVFFRADDEQLFSCSSDKTVMIWQVSVAHVSECVVAACTRVCVLPHAYPIYSCTVHQNRVLTAGYHSEIITWDIDRPEKVSEIQSSHSGSGLPDVLQRFIFDTNLHNSGTWVEDELLVGQIISRVSSDEKAVVLCVASNETGNRVWSVSSSGKVCCWRAKHETHRGENVWQMSIRKSVQCDGASDIQFRLDRVLVSCGTLPVIYIFDASSCAKLSTVRIEPSGVMPICLLPDGQAFIEGVSNGKLHAWECASGHCCTAKDGYAKVRTAFPIEEMVWASSKQMGALRSPAPCPTDLLPDLNGENPGQAKLVAPRDGVQLPLEQTAITIVGASRKDGFIIINDIAAAREFRQMFDGETEGTPSVQSKGSNSQHQRRKRKSTRSESSAMPEPVPDLHDTSEVDDHLSLTTSSMFEQQFMDTNFRINRIIGYWKSLVGKHRAPQSESEEVPSSLIGSTPRIISPIPISVANSVGVTPRSYVDVDDV